MRILVTNDDGINSPGLHVLAQRLAQDGDVTVFAPSGEYSGSGAAIGHLGHGIPDVHTIEHEDMPDVSAIHHFDGPPALCALLACLGLFGDRPDVVASGINPGWNVGHAVHFSGTIGACLAASTCGVGGVAISQRATSGPPANWATAAEVAAQLLPRAARDVAVLNVNVDDVPADQVRGVLETDLANRLPYRLQEPQLGPGGTVEFERSAEVDQPTDIDTGAVMAGYVSVTELAPTTSRSTR